MGQRILHNLAFLEKILQLTSDTLLVVDKENRCVDVMMKTDNPIFNARMDLVGKNILLLLPSPTSELIAEEFAYCRATGQTSNLNYDLPTAEKMYYFKFIIHKFDDQHLLCQYRDITQRSNMKGRLKSALMAQLEVGKEAMIGLWSFDVNKQEFTYSGYSNLRKKNLKQPEKISVSELMKVIHPDDRKMMQNFLNRSNTAQKSSVEYRLQRKGGGLDYVRKTIYERHLEPTGWVLDGFSQNVTDFIKNRNELEMVLAVVDNAPYSIFACHMQGNLAFANKACRKQNAIQDNEPLADQMVFDRLQNFKSRVEWDNFVWRLVAAEGFLQYRCDIDYPEMDIIGAECSSLIIKNGNAQDIVWTIQRDISDQLRYEEQLLRSKEAAEESERLKLAFISNMNHEIRTPLSAIIGFGNIIADTQDPELRKEYSDILTANSSQLLRLITDVLEMSQMDAGKIRFETAEVSLRGILSELSLSYGKTDDIPNIIFDIPSNDSLARLDRGRVMQVLVNLINNSIKFTPPDGQVHVGYIIQEDSIEFYVQDNGIGIAKDKQDYIFNRFFKINQADKGTGLGLAICKSIVEQMNGHIWVDSEVGKGATFRILLPFIVS